MKDNLYQAGDGLEEVEEDDAEKDDSPGEAEGEPAEAAELDDDLIEEEEPEK